MKRKTLIILSAMLGLVWSLYAVSLFLSSRQADAWGGLIAPLTTLLAGIIVIRMFFRFHEMKAVWLMSGLAIIVWFAADVTWGVMNQIGQKDPDESLVLAALYLGTNIFLSLAAAFLLLKRQNAWHRLQLLVDILAVSTVGLATIWILFLSSSFQDLINIRSEDFWWNLITFSYGVTDIFTAGCLVLWATTHERFRISLPMNHFLGGMMMFVICDLIYCIEYFNGRYDANTLLDVFYLLSFALMGFGSLSMSRRTDKTVVSSLPGQPEKNRVIRHSTILLLVPFLMFLSPSIRFGWSEFFALFSVLVFHQVVSSYISYARINTRLLEHEKQMNHILEEQIAMRTHELVEMNKELERVSNHDYITNFFNRRCFSQRLEHLLQDTAQPETLAVLFTDLDKFKVINDTFGHDTGDLVLIEIARRITEWNTFEATVARLGGDEFVIAIQGCYQPDDIALMAGELIRRCSEPIRISPEQFQITMSIGISLYPADGDAIQAELLKKADIAMYHAKAKGSNQIVFYNSISR